MTDSGINPVFNTCTTVHPFSPSTTNNEGGGTGVAGPQLARSAGEGVVPALASLLPSDLVLNVVVCYYCPTWRKRRPGDQESFIAATLPEAQTKYSDWFSKVSHLFKSSTAIETTVPISLLDLVVRPL
jgi:hypothetical protein